MKKRHRLPLFILLTSMVFSLAACGSGQETTVSTGNTEEQTGIVSADSISDVMESSDGKYEIAMITDLAQLKDKSFNEGTWNGVKLFAKENGYSYKYYQPANGTEANDTDRYDAFSAAISNGAKIIVAPGYGQYTALYQAATEHPEISFIFIDGWDVGLDNVAGIFYHEEQSGFMAGYACVKEGYTKLGFSGGGGGSNPAVNRCGYGFVQGANAAAAELGTQVEIKYSYLYGDSYSSSDALQTQINGWYASGTEVVMPYGGSMCDSVFAAAAANNALSIGGDVDQSSISATVLTSALKGLSTSVEFTLSKYYDGNWDDVKGGTQMGIEEDAAGLSIDTSRFETFTKEDYEALVTAMKSGELTASADFDNFLAGSETFSNTTVNFIK